MIVKSLCKEYQLKKSPAAKALKDISFKLSNTGMVFILGKSGSGKSTLLKLLAGLDRPSSGEIIFHGQKLSAFSSQQADFYRNTYCGFIFQEYNLLPELSVGDNIALALEMQGEKDTKEKVEAVLRQVELDGYEKRKISELSGGQRQRVAIARALIKRPEIIFADEPTGALDNKTGNAILSLLKTLSKEHLIIAVTHDREFAEKYGDRIIELEDGRIVSDSDKDYCSEEQSSFEIRRTKLPVKTAIKVGGSNFKYHPIRLIVTVLLSVIAFALFAVPLSMSLWDNERAFVDAVYDNDIALSEIHKRERTVDTHVIDQSLDQYLGSAPSYNYKWIPFSEAEIAKMQSLVSSSFIRVKDDNNSFPQRQVAHYKPKEEKLEEFMNSVSDNIDTSARGAICISEEAAKYYNFQIFGRLPVNKDEIAITEGMFRAFYFYGLLDENGIEQEINSYEDIIGKKLNVIFGNYSSVDEIKYVTITGVVENGCNYECAQNGEEFCNDILWHNKVHQRFFISEEMLKTFDYHEIYVPTPVNKEEFSALNDYFRHSTEGNIEYVIANDATSIISSKEGGLVTMLGNLFFYVGILFFFIAFIFLINFINVSIRKQLKQIGILSAMGIDRKDLIKIYGSVTGGICAVTFVLSYAMTFVVGIFLNQYFSRYFEFSISVLQFHIVVPIVLLVSLFVVAILGCVIPICLYKRKFATELINQGLIK